ncbi:hypothetical protein E2C01_101980 [Portunus trituberculatus]|uniref:Uncharacterized protein n=1 Tax=Portunus trituberculatus TaxID=210409 RepID=A0A5B7KHD1_PORTR|nr:hypothetical protein [Portunus trituberculatus]
MVPYENSAEFRDCLRRGTSEGEVEEQARATLQGKREGHNEVAEL